MTDFSIDRRDHVDTFWALVDDILNAVLFVLIGLEMIALSFQWNYLGLALLAILITLFARLVSIWLPITVLHWCRTFTHGTVRILTWGGLRGGISIALALSLPLFPQRDLILFVTYGVVIWSVLGQGLTLAPLIRRIAKPQATIAHAKNHP